MNGLHTSEERFDCTFILPNGMPPKKQTKGSNPTESALEEKLAQLRAIERHNESYERIMAIHSEQLMRSQLEKLNLKKKILEVSERLTSEEAVTGTMCHDMFRAYRAVQHTLFQKIEQQNTTIKSLNKELSDARIALERTKAEKDAICAEKTRMINEQKQKMEVMAVEFGIQLKATLEQMSHHIQGGERRAAAIAAN